MSEERWKDIPGYEGVYVISDRGTVLSHNMNQHTRVQSRVKAQQKIEGYRTVHLWAADGSKRYYCVHKLVAQLFVPNDDPVNKHHVRHINGDRDDNRAENLEWYHRGIPHTEEYKKRMSELQKGVPKWYENGRCREVKVYDYATGEFLGKYKSIAEAKRHHHLPDPGWVLTRGGKQTGGFRIEYVKKKPRYY